MTRPLHILTLSLALCLALAGCSDDDVAAADAGPGSDRNAARDTDGILNDAAPKLVKGGGTTGGAIRGRLNVHVIDGLTKKPLVGAFVMVGDGKTHQGSTDKDGLISFRKAGLNGPVSVTVALKGYTTTTVEGLDAANYTAALGPRGGNFSIKTGACKGTISGWSSLPKLPKNHLHVGMVHFLLDRNLSTPRNSVQQPKGDLNLYSPALGQKEWMVKVPAGAFGVFALIGDYDTKGTKTESDDTFSITHVGVKTGLKVQEGQTLSGVSIPVSPNAYTLNLTLPAKPAGTKLMTSNIFLELANTEIATIYQAVATGAAGTARVPKLEGDFKGGSFWAVVSASDGVENNDDDRNTESLFVKRGITGVTAPVAVSLLDLPSGHATWQGGKLGFSVPAGLTLASAKLMPEKTGRALWEVLFFKPKAGALSYTLPSLPATVNAEKPAPGKLFMAVQGLELKGVDINDANFSDQFRNMARVTQKGQVVTWQ